MRSEFRFRRYSTRNEDCTAPAGYTLVELLTGLVLTGLLGSVIVAAMMSQQRTVRALADMAERAGAIRTVAGVLPSELRFLVPRDDILGAGEDTLALRAIRGIAIVCAAEGSRAVVRYRGLRQPDPGKDSVRSAGGGPLLSLQSSRPTGPDSEGCGTIASGEEVMTWTLGEELAAGTVLVTFETGSYHLGEALRYRRGAAGRQPLTANAFDSTETRFETTWREVEVPGRAGGHEAGAFHMTDLPPGIANAAHDGTERARVLASIRIVLKPSSVRGRPRADGSIPVELPVHLPNSRFMEAPESPAAET